MDHDVPLEILTFHKDFAQQFQKHIELIREGRAPSADALVREKEDLLARLRQRLELVNEAKQQAIRRYDEEVRRCKELISQREAEIREDKKALERAAAEAAKQAKEKKGKTA